jgi:DNA-binding NtrC family response regulator
MKRMAFQHRGNRRAAAEYLGIPYSTFMRKLAKQGLNRLFCNRGKYERFQDA